MLGWLDYDTLDRYTFIIINKTQTKKQTQGKLTKLFFLFSDVRLLQHASVKIWAPLTTQNS